MNVLFVSAEAVPFAKVGGLADVVGSLPAALLKLGVDARVIIPHYGFINADKFQILPAFEFEFTRNTGVTDVHVFKSVQDGVTFYLVKGWPFFGPESTVYTEWVWDVPRFTFFNQVAMAVAWEIHQREGWFPDVLHINDWHTGLIPFFLELSKRDPNWGQVASVLSVHNMAYQGDNIGGWMWQLGIPGRNHPDLLWRGLTDNMLAIAIAYSDKVSTVSPRYATEIQYPYMGYGLDSLVRSRGNDMVGILNGLDVDLWDPETDKLIVSNYNADNFVEQRPPNKSQLQIDSGLEQRDDVMVIGVVSRLVAQKGFDLAVPALRRMLPDTDIQFILLGAGDPNLDYEFWRLGKDFPSKVKVFQGYNAALAQCIYAGCDVFLMPSHFEPCGIGQMIAMRYGALPLVRETGGLADTVQNYDNGNADSGVGFVFNWETPDALLGTLHWALGTYHNKPDAWQRMQRRAMQTDVSWASSAQKYVDLYSSAITNRRRMFAP